MMYVLCALMYDVCVMCFVVDCLMRCVMMYVMLSFGLSYYRQVFLSKVKFTSKKISGNFSFEISIFKNTYDIFFHYKIIVSV